MTETEIAIVGGGPAGLQAALVLARTRKRIVVFDSPESPRNAASHGVHNFLGLDDLLPEQIRERAWKQIDRYGSARLESQAVLAITRQREHGPFTLETGAGTWEARHVLLACGYHDAYPELDGFADCWGGTIIICPFCDGYENRDRRWGIVAAAAEELEAFPEMVQNWTSERLLVAAPELEVSPEREAELAAQGVALHRGPVSALIHDRGELSAVELRGEETVEVGTLLWKPEERPAPLIAALVAGLGLELDEHGYVAVDDSQRTNVDRLWAAGDVQGWTGAIQSANLGGLAAIMIAHGWYRGGGAVD